jgi:phosphate transport system substrate-binding protein
MTTVPSQPPPMPRSGSPDGVLRVWGPPVLAGLIDRLKADAPYVEATMTGSDVAMAALYTARADLALIGRDATEPELKAFEWVYRYPPARLIVMSGSLRTAGRSPALAVLVHRDNPLPAMTLAQLAAAFGPGKASTWGELGLDGPWRIQPIHLHAPDACSGTGRFFRQVVLHGGTKLDWARLTEYAGSAGQVSPAVARDPNALGIDAPPSPRSPLRVVPLSRVDGVAPAHPTERSVVDGAYPLARRVFAYHNTPPGERPLDKVAAFLRLLLSDPGQQAVRAEGGGHLPLATAEAARQRHLLG